MPDFSAYTTATGGLGAQAVAYARSFLGVPYAWGGTSPSGFDCSGLVQYVYEHFGITLPRTSQEQARSGVAVSRDQLQPGDLLFFNTDSSDPNGIKDSHVGIYIGNGQEIAAPHTGANVRIQAVPWDVFDTARRVSGGGAGGSTPTGPGISSGGATIPVGWHIPGTPWDIPTPGDAIGGIEGAAAGIGRTLTRIAVMGPIVLAGGALVVLGVSRMGHMDGAELLDGQ